MKTVVFVYFFPLITFATVKHKYAPTPPTVLSVTMHLHVSQTVKIYYHTIMMITSQKLFITGLVNKRC